MNSKNIEDLVPLKEVNENNTEVSPKEVGKQSKKKSWKVVRYSPSFGFDIQGKDMKGLVHLQHRKVRKYEQDFSGSHAFLESK